MENFAKNYSFIIIIAVYIATASWAGLYTYRYIQLRHALAGANAGELQSQLAAVTRELELARAELAGSIQSVGELEELDRLRLAGFVRIGAIINDAGRSIEAVAGGEQRARIAFEAIGRIVDELEAELGRGPR